MYGLEYQFMVGEELMVAPVLDPGEEAVEVYLPAGRWVHLWSDKEYGSLEGGAYETVPAPVGEPAFFYKEGTEAGPHMTVELEERGLLERFSREIASRLPPFRKRRGADIRAP